MTKTLEALLTDIETLAPLVLRILKGTAAPPTDVEAVELPVNREDPEVGLKQALGNFFITVRRAAQMAETAILDLEREMERRGNVFPREIGSDTEVTDYQSAISRYQKICASLKQLAAMHRYERLSIEERDVLISRYLSGQNNKVLVRTFSHTVARYETIESIAAQYNIADWRTLAEFNDVLPSDLQPGVEMRIPLKLSPTEAQVQISNVPVFGSLIGEEAFGRDLSNDLKLEILETDEVGESPKTDLKVLSGKETLSQGIQNIVATAPGEHPGNRAFGFDSVVSDNIPTLLRPQWFRAQAEQALLQDPRVETVRVDAVEEQGEGVLLDITIFPKANNPVRIER